MIDTRDPSLAAFGLRVCSQGEEDGITLELARRLGIANGTFVEIGVGPGYENNTRALVAHGWRGYWFGDEDAYPPDRVDFGKATVTPENVRGLLSDVVPRPVDLFSLDIDGNDYWVGEKAIPFLQPRILIVEYNHHFDGKNWIMPYTPNYRWSQGMDCGASLLSWMGLLEPTYRLVYRTKAGVNAFFVRSDLHG